MRYIRSSILMAVYKNDSAVLFEGALKSIVESSAVPTEIVLVIDGPIGVALEEIIIKFQKKLNLVIVRNERNMGLDKSLNIGLNYVSNEIVFRCDADDVNKSKRFEEQFNYLKKYPDVSAVGSQIDEFDEFKVYTGTRCVPTEIDDIWKYARFRNPLNHQTVAMRKSAVISVGGYPENTVYKEDYILWVRMLAHGLVLKNISYSLVDVSAGSSLISRRGGLRYALGEITVQKELVCAGISSAPLAILVFFVKSLVYLAPSRLLSYIYSNFLRSKRSKI